MTEASGPAAAMVAETHVSWVFFTPDRAFKLLKPIAMPWLDHTDTATRLTSAEREFELNRAIAPDVYLGTADVHHDGEVVDRFVVMRRLPAERRLSALVGTPEFPDRLRAVARAIAKLHSSRPPVIDLDHDLRDTMLENWAGNFEVLSHAAGRVVPDREVRRADELARSYLTGRRELFDRRVRDGFVRDVHGDLIADDIFCLDDGPRLIDCLAFNDRWRIIDVLSDIAFLVMDVHRLAGADHAESLMRWYQEFSGEHHPASLAHHYVAYRAHVRAKIECLRHEQGDPDAAGRARQLLDLAVHHLERARLRVILVGGGPGTGKSTLARNLGAHFGYPVLSSDEIRKDLTGTDRTEHRFAAIDDDIYRPEVTEATFAEMRREADLLLGRGRGVVLDATWRDPAQRARVADLARRHDVELVELRCVLDPARARARIARRLADPADPGHLSDATPELVDALAGRDAPWPHAIDIGTEGSPTRSLARAVDACAPLRPAVGTSVPSGAPGDATR